MKSEVPHSEIVTLIRQLENEAVRHQAAAERARDPKKQNHIGKAEKARTLANRLSRLLEEPHERRSRLARDPSGRGVGRRSA